MFRYVGVRVLWLFPTPVATALATLRLIHAAPGRVWRLRLTLPAMHLAALGVSG